ncbi:MAG: hypothetical protein JSU04_19960 [Bdellovibrionales bacterium]|nr:hypothetical protein [Bdellovibrionales bacterium]
MKSQVLSVLILLSSSYSFAQGEAPATAPAPVATPAPTSTYKIKQVISAQNLVVAETSNPNEEITPGKTFLVTFANEKQCSLILKEKKGALLTLNSSSCANAQEITRTSPLEVALVDTTVAAAEPVALKSTPEVPAASPEPYYPPVKMDRWIPTRFSVMTHYSGASELIFKDVNVTTTTSSGSVEVDYGLESSVGVGVSFASMHPQGWGYLANVFYERARAFKSATIKGSAGATTVTSSGSSSTIAFFVAEMNAVYRWDSFYMPFGLNVSAPTISEDMSGVSYYGSLGIFWGGGFILSDNATLEIFIRDIAIRMKQYTSTATIDYGNGSMTGFGAAFKFWF